MDVLNFEMMSLESVNHFIKAATPDELELMISKMNTEQIKMAIRQMDKGKDSQWQKKIRAVILGLNTCPQLEAAANKLSVAQIKELIGKTLQVEDKHHWKLSSLLVGLPFEIFSEFLFQASESELQILRHEGVKEPIQHQLTLLSHDLLNQIKKLEKEIDLFYEEIHHLNIGALNRGDILALHHKIDLHRSVFEQFFHRSNQALAIAWNTNRLDLIEAFNQVKDSSHKYNIYGIGMPRKKGRLPTGLYRELEGILFQIFGNPESGERDYLRDDEPAIEGLAKLSVWYLRDYWELGLLSSVKDPDKLDADLAAKAENERIRLQRDLFGEAQASLEKLGLSTVSDLKEALIFSKKSLQEYLKSGLLSSSFAG